MFKCLILVFTHYKLNPAKNELEFAELVKPS